MSALPILVMYKLLRVGLFTRIRDRELGLDRREPGLFYPTGYIILMHHDSRLIKYERNR